MYSSSSITLFLKYFFPMLYVTVLVLGFFDLKSAPKELTFLVVLTGILIFLYIRIFGKLRKVRAHFDHLVTDTISYEETIPYDKIIYIYQVALFDPIMIGVKYIDEETGELKKFYTLASWSSRISSFNWYGVKEVELTKFIRRRAKSTNPDYDESEEPSRWAPFVYTILTLSFGVLASTYW